MDPPEFAGLLRKEKASAILRTDSKHKARKMMEAAISGGFRVLEFTLTIPGAMELVEEFSSRPGLAVGAGTVLAPEQAVEAVGMGARFLVSPVVDEQVIATARKLGVACVPGAFTPTEMLRAERAGATLVKLFPAPADGPAYVRQVLGPLPHLKLVPTAGVDERNAAEYLRAGAWAVGFTTSLFSAKDIEARARELLAACAK